MTNLQTYNSGDIELVFDNQTGEAFATLSGYSRMTGVNPGTISRRISSSLAETGVKKAKVLTPPGLRSVALIPAETIFLWAMKDKPELAVMMGKVGATVYLHQLAGFTVKSTASGKPQSKTDTLKQLLSVAEEMLAVREQGQLMPGYDMITDAAIDGIPDSDVPMSLDEWLLALDVHLSPSELGYVRQALVSSYVAMYHRKPSTRRKFAEPVLGKKGKMVQGNCYGTVCVYPPSSLPLIRSVLETIGTPPVQ